MTRRAESRARWNGHSELARCLSESQMINPLVLVERVGRRREPNPGHIRDGCRVRRRYRKLLTVCDIRCRDRCDDRTNGR